MKPSLIIKHSVVIRGHKTSVSLEKAYWIALKNIAHRDGVGHNYLVSEIDRTRGHHNLSSAIRLFVLDDAERRAVPIVTAVPSSAVIFAGEPR